MPNWTKEQLDAINKDGTNIIVSAGAGSGKTAVLTERVIRKLNEGVKIDELLILTFTNAAAKEMKSRIREEIEANEELKSQLELIDSAYITTFDSYALSILRKYHYLLNLSPNIEITDESIIKMKQENLIEEIFEELYESHDKDFENLIDTFCTKDDKNIKESILKIAWKLELKIDIDSYLKNYIEDYFNKEKIDNDIVRYEHFLKVKLGELNELLEKLSQVCDSDFFSEILDSVQPLFDSETYEEFLKNSNVKLPRAPQHSEEELKTLKTELNKKINDFKILLKYENIDEIYDSIMSTKPYVTSIIKIIEILNERTSKFKSENNLYTFTDVAKLSIKILKENKEIREEIKNNLNEIMIDEYQDTSDIQEEFISLISNNNVYMVGDVKQSIYRFRNANPYIFKDKYDRYSNSDGGIKIDLSENFRSREEVLNNINAIFECIMDDDIGGAEYRVSHKMKYGNKAYQEEGNTEQNNDIEMYKYDYDSSSNYDKEEIEAFIIANDIKNKVENKYKIFDKNKKIIRDAKYEDFVILMDKSKHFEIYKKIFEFMKIPLSIEKEESIKKDVMISIIKNLLILINKVYKEEYDLEFKYMFISIGRSFLIEMSDEEIFDIYNSNDFTQNDLYDKVKNISNRLDSINIYELIELIIEEFNIYDNLIKIGLVEEKTSIIEYMLDLSKSFIKPNYTIDNFIEYLVTLNKSKHDIKVKRNKDETDSVKIMTIHGSKGLEYHICYYTGLYYKFNIDELKERFLYNNLCGIVTPYFNEGIDNTIYKELLKYDYVKEEVSEKIRLFYVALTRAKEKMIVVCNIPKEKDNYYDDGIARDRIKYRSFNDILISIMDNISGYVKNIDLDKIEMNKDYLKIKKTNYSDFISKSDIKLNIKELSLEETIKEEKTFSKKQNKIKTKEERDSIKFGLDIHYILEILDLKNPNLEELNVNDFIKTKISKFLSNDIIKNIKDGKIYKEYEFIYEEDNIEYHGIIDLMVVYDDHIDIIDYKLKNIDDENYINQLNGYKKYIENKTGKKVNIYLYSIIEEEVKEIRSK